MLYRNVFEPETCRGKGKEETNLSFYININNLLVSYITFIDRGDQSCGSKIHLIDIVAFCFIHGVSKKVRVVSCSYLGEILLKLFFIGYLWSPHWQLKIVQDCSNPIKTSIKEDWKSIWFCKHSKQKKATSKLH